MSAVNRDRELELIGALCLELAKRRMNVGLSDARPAVRSPTGMGGCPLIVTVDKSAIDHDGGLCWAWLWAGPTHDAPPEIEPMVAISEVDEAALRISNVLRVDAPEGAQQ